MKTIASSLLTLFTIYLVANPVVKLLNAAATTPMVSEKVVVTINTDNARVSGCFKFDLRKVKLPSNPCLRVYVPIVIREGAIDSSKTLDPRYERDTDMTVRIGREDAKTRAVHPGSPENSDHPTVVCTRGLELLWFEACPEVSRKTSNVEVSYSQALLDGVFYYMPIIRPAPDAVSSSQLFTIRVIAAMPLYPAEGMACSYRYHGPREMVVTPSDNSLIAVTSDISKAASSFRSEAKE